MEPVMHRERAEVACLICGRNLGQIEQRNNRMRLIAPPDSANSAELVRKRGVGMTCGRCGGRALVGPLERIAEYAA
jgi:DNA-directed RNA polymerase subunit RPC12/RpoP